MKNQGSTFYKDIKRQDISLRELLMSNHLFSELPIDWYVVDTEIDEPSLALENNGQKDMNLVASGLIITVLNTIKAIDRKVQIPYFFKGSGATFIVSEPLLSPVLEALEIYKIHVKTNLNLSVRIGEVKVEQIYKSGATIRISKLKLNHYLTTPVILGNGLNTARCLIENKAQIHSNFKDNKQSINLQGMECRWDEIFPNEDENRVICLLVHCQDESKQAGVFTKIISEIDYIFGDLTARLPIATGNLKLDNSFQKTRKEMYARLGTFSRRYLIQNWLITYFGKYYFRFFKGGKEYLFKVTQLADTLILDGSINTVFSGTEKQINKLILLLDSLEADGKILYGIHLTHASIMSCYIEDRDENHIHFVDGTEGGYKSAAIKIKSKLKTHRSPSWEL